MKVKEVADLVGISVRTLHHYDEIGLLKPGEITEAGYRLYSDQELERLQQILFFRELDFPLKKIKEILSSPAFNKEEALQLQRRMLHSKQRQLEQMIRTIDRTILHMRGEIVMTNEQKFEGFSFGSNPYEQEARERYGDESVDNSKAQIGKMTEKEQADLASGMNAIYFKLAALRNDPPESEQSQAAIQEWYNYLNKLGSYSLEAFKGLGQMYVEDGRFMKNIDQFGEGLAVFMRDAMAVYADQNK
ncbi:MerR family transcriptional regulator [Paenibacillus sp. FSL H8-0548]|uniref:MerR family transcriptional regulator n=1 Tax=Paenibacillus sp. FSL H8-0548 TaxID=1920422 RepID=UPI00096EC90F|nr:MerR family transcriptional regulator [Paenibacillus sp. FSL H8-0548]OMF30038.1 MerR family transcriptional regulator [Paenibacillus sp. FSL H8-0548]